MAQKKGGFGEILSLIKVDMVGVTKLQDWKGAPVADSAKKLLPAANMKIFC